MPRTKKKSRPVEKSLLPSQGVFAVLSKAEQREFLKQFKMRALSQGDYLVRAKEKAKNFYVVMSGNLEVSRTNRGKSIVLNLLGEGDIVGEISALGGMERTADVVCLSPCTVAEIQVSNLHEKLSSFPRFAAFIMRSLALRLSRSTDLLFDLATEDVPSRVLRALKSLEMADTGSRSSYLLIRERPTHAALARMVGTSREVVGRALQLLEQAGEIQQEGRQIFVRRPSP